jgi:hypothetical protein
VVQPLGDDPSLSLRHLFVEIVVIVVVVVL